MQPPFTSRDRIRRRNTPMRTTGGALALLAAAAALLARADASAVNTAVSTTDENACNASPPDKPTLRRNSDDEEYAVVVYPNCTVVSLTPSSGSDSGTAIDASSLGVQAVTSCPNVDQLCVPDGESCGLADLRTRVFTYGCGRVFYRILSDNSVTELSDSEGDCQVTMLYGPVPPSACKLHGGPPLVLTSVPLDLCGVGM